MEKYGIKRAVELCLAVYRLTDKFPREEVLRYKIRDLAIDIIEATAYKISYPKKRLGVLFLCFDVADKQGWVDSRNYEILKREYARLYREIAMVLDRDPKPGNDEAGTLKNLTEKQKNIVEFLKSQSNGAAIPIIAKAVKKSVRTVVRDLKILQNNNLVAKEGKTRGSKFYAI